MDLTKLSLTKLRAMAFELRGNLEHIIAEINSRPMQTEFEEPEVKEKIDKK